MFQFFTKYFVIILSRRYSKKSQNGGVGVEYQSNLPYITTTGTHTT
jgi:hypothetical protein